jgi:hypothetical protein
MLAAGNRDVAENGGSVIITAAEATLVRQIMETMWAPRCVLKHHRMGILFNWYFHTDDSFFDILIISIFSRQFRPITRTADRLTRAEARRHAASW